MERGRTTARALLLLCSVLVIGALFITPKIGRCGTLHFFFFQVLGGVTVTVALSTIRAIQNQTAISATAVALNAATFLIPASLLYLKAPRNWYVAGLLLWTVAYLLSYFLLIPVPDCP